MTHLSRTRLTLLVQLLVWAAFFAPMQAQALAFTPCSLTGSSGNGNLAAECATWTQPLNRQDTNPNGAQIELFVARLPATALEPAADALTIINGGPGGSSVDLLVDLAQVFQSFTRERDVIVIDQRGTGRSAPLTCPALTDTAEEADPDQTATLTQACLDELSHDPRYFTTSVAVEDLEALRQNLGYATLSLYGVSYGTRVAQHYARRYPASTRALIIDGVIPMGAALGPQVPVHSQQTLDQIMQSCSATDSCARAFPELTRDFQTLSQTLRKAPVALTLAHPITGEPTQLDLTYNHLAVWLRFSLYAPEGAALIPLIVSQAANEQRYVPIAANAVRLLHNVTSALNYGMHNAVVCTEDAPFYGNDVDLNKMADTYLGKEIYETLRDICAVWPAGYLHEDLKAPLQHDIPTLVLSGELDPITPPAWGEEAATGLGRVQHIVAPGQGHGVIARGCIPRLALSFIESADPSSVDSACIKHLAAYPFFVNLMGPPP